MVRKTEPSRLGRASIEPTEAVIAGSYATWTITYEVGELGLDDGGSVMVAFSQTTDMGDPQFDDPAAANHCTVETARDVRVDAEYDPSGYVRPMKDAVKVTVVDGALEPGDTIELTLGDTAGGSLGMAVQTFPEEDFAFRVAVDPHNAEDFVALPEDLTVDVVPGVATDVAAVVDSTAEPGEDVELGVRATDHWGNVATGFDGEASVDAPDGLDAPDSVPIGDGSGTATVRPTERGVYRLRVHVDELDATARSNPLACRDAVAAHTYWGDPHGQTGETVGTGTVEGYFEHLAGPAFLDFGAHAANDFQVTDDLWETIKAAGRAVHEPGEFVSVHGYEWSANTSLGGDHNVYFRGDDPDIERSSNWLIAGGDERLDGGENGVAGKRLDRDGRREAEGPIDGDGRRETEGPIHGDGERGEAGGRIDGTHPIETLYEAYEGREDVLIIPHIGGRPASLDVLDPDLTPFLEIVSVWGVFEPFACEAYDRGHPVGLVGGSDDHSGRPGTAPPDRMAKHNVEGGLTAARAPELTRDALWEAFTDRSVYATTGERILLDVDVAAEGDPDADTGDGNPDADTGDGDPDASMGDRFAVEEPPAFDVSVHGTAPLRAVDCFRGSELVATRDLTRGDDVVEIEMSGARSRFRNKRIDWDGGAVLDRGRITDVEPFGYDHPEDGVVDRRPDAVSWEGRTTGNYEGVRLRIDAPDDATLRIGTEQAALDVTLDDLTQSDPRRVQVDGVEAGLAVRRVGHAEDLGATVTFEASEVPEEPAPYWMRVRQADGGKAWSSPIFVEEAD